MSRTENFDKKMVKKKPRIRISKRKIVEFCKRNHIRRLAFFGSVLRTDLVRAHHRLDAAREVLDFSIGKSRFDLDTDRMLNLSLVHLLEIIGEAAVGISVEWFLFR